jgi:2-dehydropantoate 2-reductase
VSVVGPGAVGCYFGGMLARAGAPVTLVGRPGRPSPHLEAIARDGLRMRTVSFDERVRVGTSSDPANVAGADAVLLCVKTVDTETATERIAPHLAPRTIVADLQNGFDNPERMRRLGVDPIPAAVYVAAAIEVPGEVHHRGRGDLLVGHRERRADVERLAAWFERAGVPCRITDAIERELWLKLAVNSMANAISALGSATYGRLATFAPTWEVALDVGREAVAVARADGHDLDFDEVVERCRAVTHAVGAATSSTEQDLSRGRPTEIDALNGYVARRGAALGLPVPVNHALWALVKLREERASGSNRGRRIYP